MPGIQARKARGCDLAFTAPTELQVEGGLPGGGKDPVIVRVASIVPFLVMKGMALSDRLKEKDPWDIYYCVRHFPGGLDALAAEFRPNMRNGLVREGLEKIAAVFASVDHVGPVSVADFEEVTSLELERLAYLFAVNKGHPRIRKRFSFAHEYAHVLLDRDRPTVSRASERDELREVRANAFAAAFLMPEKGVRRFMPGFSRPTPGPPE